MINYEIHRERSGEHAESHYSDLSPAAAEGVLSIPPDTVASEMTDMGQQFNPAEVKKHLKAGPRKQTNRQTTRRKTATVTGTSKNEALEREQQIKESKKR